MSSKRLVVREAHCLIEVFGPWRDLESVGWLHLRDRRPGIAQRPRHLVGPPDRGVSGGLAQGAAIRQLLLVHDDDPPREVRGVSFLQRLMCTLGLPPKHLPPDSSSTPFGMHAGEEVHTPQRRSVQRHHVTERPGGALVVDADQGIAHGVAERVVGQHLDQVVAVLALAGLVSCLDRQHEVMPDVDVGETDRAPGEAEVG